MIVAVDATNKQITFTFTTEEWDVLVWARNKHGATAVKEGFRDWLHNWWRQRENERLKTLEQSIPEGLGG